MLAAARPLMKWQIASHLQSSHQFLPLVFDFVDAYGNIGSFCTAVFQKHSNVEPPPPPAMRHTTLRCLVDSREVCFSDTSQQPTHSGWLLVMQCDQLMKGWQAARVTSITLGLRIADCRDAR
jgi:hypothetical protein